MGTTPDVPPWRPIADWLIRLHYDDGPPTGTHSQEQLRKDFEAEAKAIAYDIATHGADESPSGKRVTIEGKSDH